MLTMGTPIKLKTVRSMDTLGNGFAERIMGNYQMMEEQMTPSDMLHFISAPPELYMEDAGMAPLVKHQNTSNIQNVQIQLLNNVLNRILVSDTFAMTYQDRVFVENILQKIGVTDVKEFMRQVHLVKEETRNMRELINLYQSGEDMVNTIREYRMAEEAKRKDRPEKSEETEATNVYWIQQEVLNRLQTEEIYQEMSQLISARYGSPISLSRQEMQISEQSINGEYLTLNRLRSQTFLNEQNLVYNRVNTYEAGDVEQLQETYDQTVSNMVQAVLLGAVSQIYHMRYNDLTSHASSWKWLTDALYINAENTFQRFESYHNRLNLTQKEKDEYHKTLQQFEQQEITALQRLIQHTEEIHLNGPKIRTENETELNYRTEENYTEEGDRIETTVNEVTQRLEDSHRHVFKISEKKREEEIRHQLDIINRQNLERLEKLRVFEQEQKRPEPKKINRGKAREDGLRALEDPQQVVMEYLQNTENHTTEETVQMERLKEIIGADTVKVLETIRGYQAHPERYPNVTSSEGQAMNLLMHDIAGQQKAQEERVRVEQQQIVHTQVQQETSREVERVLRETQRYQTEQIPSDRKTDQTDVRNVELFHKQNETNISEEFLQEMENRNRKTIQNEIYTTTEQMQETTHVAELVTNKVNELKLEQDQNIERIVSQNVRQQLNTLSDQVFSKLEKRMDSERRRRGL